MAARPHHGLDYIEFTAPDLATVEAFYSVAFGWRFTERGDGYVAFSSSGLGGFFEQGPARPGGALVTLYSRDLEASLDSVQRAGGHICKGIFAFHGGRRFQFTDPAGYELAVWSDVPPSEGPQDGVQRAQHDADQERKHAGAKGSAGARSARPRRVRSRFTARQTAAKFRVVCSPTTKKHRACISALVSDTDSVLVDVYTHTHTHTLSFPLSPPFLYMHMNVCTHTHARRWCAPRTARAMSRQRWRRLAAAKSVWPSLTARAGTRHRSSNSSGRQLREDSQWCA